MRAKILATVGALLWLLSATLSAASDQLPSPSAGHSEQRRISVQVEGAGKDVILIPGLASSREVWADLVSRLRQSHRLHLIQLAGFAGSPAPLDTEGGVMAPAVEAIAEYIRAQHIHAPVIIGHSLGGEAALMLGARHPDLVGRLMIVDALPFYSLLMNPSATSETVAPHAVQMRDSLLAASAEQTENMQKLSIARLVKTQASRPCVLAASINSDRRAVANAVYELMVTDLRPELSHIRAPVEVVYAYDPLYGVPSSNVDALFHRAYASTSNVQFTRIDGSFHFVMLDQPERFASTVETFLGK
ncbi:alpha/beta hydrolase [Pseudomonas sp. G.S.17]|uniref:alpha/beta fold hydrolase n=1 Tax=Pseudomonas sp. G.S.17 TaxID=3137451 RepID=UPI00311C9F4B